MFGVSDSGVKCALSFAARSVYWYCRDTDKDKDGMIGQRKEKRETASSLSHAISEPTLLVSCCAHLALFRSRVSAGVVTLAISSLLWAL